MPPSRLSRTLTSYYALTIHICAVIAAFVDPWALVALWIFALTTPLVESWVHRVNARAA